MDKRKRYFAGCIVSVLFLCACLCGMRATVQAASDFVVDGRTITITQVRDGDLYPVIKSAVDYARKNGYVYTIKVPAGDYTLSSCIHVYGNICLDLTDVTLRSTASTGNMLMLGTKASNMNEKKESGYGSRGNITVIGGCWIANDSNTSSIVRMAHASDIRFEGCVFSGGGCLHQMEVAALDGFVVRDCTFKDMARVTGTDGKKEALQLDMPCTTSAFKNVVLDGTPMKNVEITGCVFRNVPRGVGTHSMLVGAYHTNINISDNTFKNVDGECIIALNYQNCNIRGNWIESSGAGIVFESFKPAISSIHTSIFDGRQYAAKPLNHNADVMISDNHIYLDPDKYADDYVAIQVYGHNLEKPVKSSGNGPKDVIPAANYYVSNVRVIGNDIETSGTGIYFSDVKNSTISGNKIFDNVEGAGLDGIILNAGCEDVAIRDNKIEDSTRYGIEVTEGSIVQCISGNEVSGTGWAGIHVEQDSVITDGIEDNIVQNCNDNGIQLDSASVADHISENSVLDCSWHGIDLQDNSSVTGSISSNIVRNCGVNGIFLNGDCSAKSITDNVLSGNQKYGIALYDNSILTGDISSNTINGNKSHAIQLNMDCEVKNIKKNKITDAKGKGIVVESGCSVDKAISGNSINKTKLEGIYIHSTDNKLEIMGNTIRNCGRSPIIINTESPYKIVISKNKITTTKGQKALSVTRGKVKSDIGKKNKNQK